MPKIKGTTRRIFSLRLKKHRQIGKNIDPTSINLSYSKACTKNIQIKHVFNFRGMKEIRNNRKRTSSQCSFEVRSIITRQNYHIRVSGESKGHRNGSEDRQADPERESFLVVLLVVVFVVGVRWPRCEAPVTLSLSSWQGSSNRSYTFSLPLSLFLSLLSFFRRQRWTLIWERGKRIRRWRVRAFRVRRARSFSERRVRSHASNCKWCTCSSHMSKTNLQLAHSVGPSDAIRVSCPGKGFLLARTESRGSPVVLRCHSPFLTFGIRCDPIARGGMNFVSQLFFPFFFKNFWNQIFQFRLPDPFFFFFFSFFSTKHYCIISMK